MKTKYLLFVFAMLFHTAFTVVGQNIADKSQKPVYPKPNSSNDIPFGKKLPPPPDLNFQFKADNHINYPPSQSLPVSGASFNKTRLLALAKITHQQNNNKSQSTNNTHANFHLTKDINTVGDSYPVNSDFNGDDFKASFAVLNSVAYFNATDGIHGPELWRSDGTTAGTYMVKDINPGEASSGPYNITAANSKIYFSAYTDDYGWEPWISDGTEAGTQLLLDINSGNVPSYPGEFVGVNNAVFFTSSNDYGNVVWKTDGTSAGTQLVYDFTAYDQYSGYVTEAVTSNGLYFFSAYTPTYGRELWRSDGTQAGTYMAKDIGPDQGDYYSPLQLTNYNHKLYFSGDDGSGRKLWVSDGTYAGTYPVTNNNNILVQTDFLNYTFNYPFAILNNTLFFGGYSSADANGLYKYNASNTDGIKLVKDFTSTFDVDFLVPTALVKVGNALYFKVINSIGEYHDELWTSEGKMNNTQLIKSFESNHITTNYYDGYGTLYFNEDDPIYGTELWKSNGTDASTGLIKDVFAGSSGSSPSFITTVNGRILFGATNITKGAELWRTNGTEISTALVKDINSGNTTDNSDAGFLYKGIAKDGNNGVVFGAFTPEHGGELYKSDGTKPGTQFLNDIAAGAAWSYPNSFLFKNNVDYFIGDNLTGTAIYKTNGTKNGLQQVVYNIDRSIYSVYNFNVTDNGLPIYVLFNKNTFSYELWRSDGTAGGTYALSTTLYYSNDYIVTIGNIAFFVAGDDVHGYELWKTDGTVNGTKIVKDINKGINSSYPYSLFVYKNEVYFGANDGGFNNSFWKTDGTKNGTVKLKNITPAKYDYDYNYGVQYFCVSNNILYFDATDFNEYGAELWRTDGSAAGTRLVKDINRTSYPPSSYPSNLTDVNGTLFFTADDGINGMELWSSDGSIQNTKLVKNITINGSSYLYDLTNANGQLYFLLYDALWKSDGTEANTNQVIEDGLNGLSRLTNLTASGNKLFFGAYSSKYGTELYAGNTTSNCFIAAKTNAGNISISPKINTVFRARLLTNPVTDQIKISVDIETQQQANVIITDMSGRTIVTDKKILSAGTNIFSYDTKALTQGIYMIHIVTADGSSSLLKAVK